MQAQQLSLFQKEVKKQSKIYYIDLNINQKINVRANSCGFAVVYYNWTHQKKFFQLQPSSFSDRFDGLTLRYKEHYKLNY